MTKFAERLIELREENKVTLQMLADYLNVDKSTVSRWENKECIPNIENAYQIAIYFNVSLDYLVGLENERG